MISGRMRDGRHYDIGQVLHAPKVGGLGGGPDQHWYTVLAETAQRANEDMGSPDAMRYAWVRAATEEEAAPLAERATRAKRLEELQYSIPCAIQAAHTGDDARGEPEPPSGAKQIIVGRRMAGSEIIYYTEERAYYRTSSYDDGPAIWSTPLTDALRAEISELAAASPPSE